jgi:hypothetical protein
MNAQTTAGQVISAERLLSNVRPYHHQVPPYGLLGKPYVLTKHIMLYVNNNRQHRRHHLTWSVYQQRRLSEQLSLSCMTINYLFAHAVCLALLGLVQIGLQVALMILGGALWFVAAGVWSGAYFILTGFLTIFLGE